jgi:thiosulfate/3-mercaptopyruvate sulfurtransferase
MTPLITANQLEEIINSGENVLLCDCRFDLADTSAGKKAYEEGHIPAAIYVDLDQDLSGEKTGRKGRRIEPMYGFRLTDTWL